MKRLECVSKATASDNCVATEEVHIHIQGRIRSSPYAFHFNKVTWHFAGGILTLQGRVATFHLKQILQTMLRDIKHVQRLANEVEVISATGLSSVRKR